MNQGITRTLVVDCYHAYVLTNEDVSNQAAQMQDILHWSDDTLALMYEEWRICEVHERRDLPRKAGISAVIAPSARALLQNKATRHGPGDASADFARFCRLFLRRGDFFPPFYDVFDQYWNGFDTVLQEGEIRTISLLPHPCASDVPRLAWVFNRPLSRQTIVCLAFPLHFAGDPTLPAGRLGRVESWGGQYGHVQWQGHPHLVVCSRDMLMVPRGELPRKWRPPQIKSLP